MVGLLKKNVFYGFLHNDQKSIMDDFNWPRGIFVAETGQLIGGNTSFWVTSFAMIFSSSIFYIVEDAAKIIQHICAETKNMFVNLYTVEITAIQIFILSLCLSFLFCTGGC